MLKQTPLIQIQNLSHSYHNASGEDYLVLDNVNFELNEAEIVCLLGRSGSGKSTLMKIISGLLEPTKGQVLLEGHPLLEATTRVSMVFQNFSLFPWLNVLENIQIGLQAQNIKPAECERRSLFAVDLIGLNGYEEVYPKSLSGGMQQRVGLARALVMKPVILLMDEPFSALDTLTAEVLRSDLLDLWIEGRMSIKSILMITHNIEEAVLMADRILIFGSNPGCISDEVRVDFPHPRNRLDPEFRKLVNEIYEKITAKEQQLFRKEGTFSGIGIEMALPYISSNQLQGFIEAVVSIGHKDIEFSSLVTALNVEIDAFLKIAEVLQLFRFCELESASLHLTPQGLEFSQESIEGRKKLFQIHLKKYVPLAAHILKILESNPQHKVPFHYFSEEIQQHMPQASAEEALRAVTSWARYSGLFMYNEQSKMFCL